MTDLMDWLGDVFYIDQETIVHREGFTTEHYSRGSNYEHVTIKLPFDETVTTTEKVFNWQAGGAFLLVVLTFITVVTVIREAVLK